MSRTPAQMARVGLRSSASLGVTLGLWGCMDVDSLLKSESEQDVVLHKWVQRWARTLLKLFGVRLHARGPYLAEGQPHAGRSADGIGRVFVMNHRSGIDILIAFAHTDSRLVSRHDLARWPLIGRGAQRLGTLFVDRSSKRSGATVVKAMTRALEAGQGIFIFPEGTAFAGDEVRAFKPGAFNAARRSGAEIVPLGIAYADPRAAYGDETFIEHLERVAAMPSLDVAIEVGEPIVRGESSQVELRDRTHQRVEQLVRRARGHLAEIGLG